VSRQGTLERFYIADFRLMGVSDSPSSVDDQGIDGAEATLRLADEERTFKLDLGDGSITMLQSTGKNCDFHPNDNTRLMSAEMFGLFGASRFFETRIIYLRLCM